MRAAEILLVVKSNEKDIYMKYQAISLLLASALSAVTLPAVAEENTIDSQPGLAVSARLSTLGFWCRIGLSPQCLLESATSGE